MYTLDHPVLLDKSSAGMWSTDFSEFEAAASCKLVQKLVPAHVEAETVLATAVVALKSCNTCGLGDFAHKRQRQTYAGPG